MKGEKGKSSEVTDLREGERERGISCLIRETIFPVLAVGTGKGGHEQVRVILGAEEIRKNYSRK